MEGVRLRPGLAGENRETIGSTSYNLNSPVIVSPEKPGEEAGMMAIAGRDGRNASCFLLLLTFVLFALISIFEEKKSHRHARTPEQ